MAGDQIRFSDGASYELLMGEWSRLVGNTFLDWLKPATGLTWLDVGCGSGAFSKLIIERCAPRWLLGIDPSDAQLDFARDRGLGPIARFEVGDAMRMDMPGNSVDVAVAALVMHFMPDPSQGVREMARVVRPGGIVAAYTWNLEGGGFPYEAVHRAMTASGLTVPNPPHPEAGNADELAGLWTAAGVKDLIAREISVTRTFLDFDDYWELAVRSPRIAAVLNDLAADRMTQVREATRRHVPEPPVVTARANAISGRTKSILTGNLFV